MFCRFANSPGQASGCAKAYVGACKKHSEQPFPSIVVEEARGVVKRILKEHGAQLDLDAVPERQPFYLALLEEFLRLCGDPDASAYFSGKDSFAGEPDAAYTSSFRKEVQVAFL